MTARVVAVGLAGVLAGPAEAKLAQLYLQGQGGYSAGSGSEEAHPVYGTVVPQRQDFYKLVNGGAVGVEGGLTLIGIDLNASFLQFMEGGDTAGTVTKIILGLRPTIDPGDKGDFTLFFRLGAGMMIASYGAQSPLAAEVGETPLGFAARGGLGVSYDLGGPFEIGPQVDVGYYRLLNGAITPSPALLNEIDARCMAASDQAACAQMELDALSGDAGVGYETSSGVDWSAMFVLRAAFGL